MTIKHIHRDQVVSLRHALREDNTAANFLTKKGTLSDNNLVILYEVLLDMLSVLLTDATYIGFARS